MGGGSCCRGPPLVSAWATGCPWLGLSPQPEALSPLSTYSGLMAIRSQGLTTYSGQRNEGEIVGCLSSNVQRADTYLSQDGWNADTGPGAQAALLGTELATKPGGRLLQKAKGVVGSQSQPWDAYI